jgi:hypothetical protein
MLVSSRDHRVADRQADAVCLVVEGSAGHEALQHLAVDPEGKRLLREIGWPICCEKLLTCWRKALA